MQEKQQDSFWARRDPLRQRPPVIDRTAAFKQAKQAYNKISNPSRFAPKSDLIRSTEFEPRNDSTAGDYQRRGTGLAPDRVLPQLPPMWVDTAEEFDEILNQINKQLEQLKDLKSQRFKPKFDNKEDDTLDVKITELRGQIYFNLKECESKLKTAKRQMLGGDYDQMEGKTQEQKEQICENVCQAYFVRLRDATQRLRRIERDHIDKISKLYGVQGEVYLLGNELDVEPETNNSQSDGTFRTHPNNRASHLDFKYLEPSKLIFPKNQSIYQLIT